MDNKDFRRRYPNEFWISSSEAIVDAIWEQSVNSDKNGDLGNEKIFRQKVWSELMDRLIIMIEKWE